MHLETPMGTSNRIEINPDVMRGKPVIRGTRVTVELLLRKLSEGATEESLLDSYPLLTREDIKAAIAYAAAPSRSRRQTTSHRGSRRRRFSKGRAAARVN